MSNFINILRTIKNNLFGIKNTKELTPAAIKNDFEEKASFPSKVREPYYIQIGFDFGTSYSKCIYRDIHKDKAWIYCSDELNSEYPFLIPSAIIFHGNSFRRHNLINVQYPQNGLFNIKFAMEKIALGAITSPVLDRYKSFIGSNYIYDVSHFVECCAVFFLATSFSNIITKIKHRFKDFGQDPRDQLAINMAIPVASASQHDVSTYYKTILKKSWIIANNHKLTDISDIHRLESIIRECDTKTVDDTLCFIYPEVSANVQTFIHSPASSPDPRTIYFFSDTGAGTVDQSVFTYYIERLNYFAAEVLPLGSSHIDRKACGDHITLEKMEYWRNEKESGNNHKNIVIAKQKIEAELARESHRKTLKETLKRLHTGHGVTPVSTLKEHVRLIFAGGGHSKDPYELSVVKAFRQYGITPDIIAMRTPSDLELEGHQQSWMKRLFVAYGLSFSSVNLIKTIFPNKTIIEVTIQPLEIKNCSCCGTNPNCIRCSGRGWEW